MDDDREIPEMEGEEADGNRARVAGRLYFGLVLIFQAIMAFEAVLLVAEQQWLNALLVAGIMALVMAPAFIAPRLHVRIPAEFQALTVVFVFATLFLGETLDYYNRFAWWDGLLHGFSGLLLGVFGFLLVYVLNENRSIEMTLKPGFVAFFAFLFALSVGTLWEIFEFAVDEIFGQSMQQGGLPDTMWDLVADAAGALAISVFGWWYLKRPERSFIERWVQEFIRRNPRLFRR